MKINFLGCEDATVYSDSFLDYYLIGSESRFFNSEATRFSGSGLNLHLLNTSGKVYVITASEDTVVSNTHMIVKDIIIRNKKNIKLYQVDGADHFFRDFYFDDLMQIIIERVD